MTAIMIDLTRCVIWQCTATPEHEPFWPGAGRYCDPHLPEYHRKVRGVGVEERARVRREQGMAAYMRMYLSDGRNREEKNKRERMRRKHDPEWKARRNRMQREARLRRLKAKQEAN